jgi:putative spermidine/putrescine transport system substrate-binding protein
MNRRPFLMSFAALLVQPLLHGCSVAARQPFRVHVLQRSIPVQVLEAFKRSLTPEALSAVDLKFTPAPQLQGIFDALQHWQQPTVTNTQDSPLSTALGSIKRLLPFMESEPDQTVPDLVTLGDYWLATAIQQGLVQPLAVPKLSQWPQVPKRWQQLVTRDHNGNLAADGAVWGAPYRWGTTLIAYNSDKLKALGWQPQDWSDLWRPELQGRISLLDQPREVIGLTLKQLGHSYNTQNLQSISKLELHLRDLHQQAKFYSSENYLQPLLMGDTWVAVGWSSDVLAVMRRHPEIKAVIPRSGTALWADLWVRPKLAPISILAEQWVNFCWQPDAAQLITELSQATSPLASMLAKQDLYNVQHHALLLLEPDVFEQCEFLEPLPTVAQLGYEALWQKIRQE